MPRLSFPSGDTALMPRGSKMYVPRYEALTTFLRVDLSEKYSDPRTLDQLSAWYKREIQSFGGHRYMWVQGTSIGLLTESVNWIVEYNGALYKGELLTPGLRPPYLPNGVSHVDPRPAYNKTAMDFLLKQLGPNPQQIRSPYMRPM
ncbi:hypothetical protein [Caballeronia sp. ATUFL_F2_KS9A]|uniref:hypothetical protein n=1 Tax=Caballeronia sp. ATUFL_F2_KS9A TaxID=2921777 RepID=UPI0020287D89|nr:hypothetical protein [Caballeronia sp. ATUFL_F2_KS9A]